MAASPSNTSNTSSTSNTPNASTHVGRAGLAMIFIGSALALLGPQWFDGFVKGLFQGAGVALIVLGVVALSARRRTRRGGGWLPSRDDV